MGNAQGKGEQWSGIDAATALEQDHLPSAPTAMGRVPLAFHEVHGENVRLSNGGRVAKRVESFCKGLAFSNRPIAVDEIVCVKFTEISKNWSGVLRFGLSNNDPATLVNDLPRFACPNLTNKEGNWAKALPEKYCQQGAILHFYVRENGEMFYGINGVQKGQFLVGINTRAPLYVILDIYGNSTAVQFLDPAEVPPLRSHRGSSSAGPSVSSAGPSTSVAAQTERLLAAEFRARASISHSRCHAGVDFRPLTFHSVTGANVTLSANRTVASRLETEYTQGYVFTQRPLRVGEKLVIQVLWTLGEYEGGLAMGLTSCDPAHLRPHHLPPDSDLLIDRPEYWVVAKDVASKPRQGDELAFYISPNGEMYYYKNNAPPRVILHVDHTQALWLFFDIYGNTQRIQMLGLTDVESRGPEAQESRSSRSHSSAHSSPAIHPVNEAEQNLINFDAAATPGPSGGGGSGGLRVNLPPPPSETASTPRRPPRPASTASYTRPPLSARTAPAVPPPPPPRPKPPPVPKPSATGQKASPGGEAVVGEECTVCMVTVANCVLYTCGHMCMCYECARQLRRVKANLIEVREKSGECPICRQMIYDVIKIFKS